GSPPAGRARPSRLRSTASRCDLHLLHLLLLCRGRGLGIPIMGTLESEHRDFRPAPVQHPLAVAQTTVDIEVAAVDGVITMRVVAVAPGIQSLAQPAGRHLPAMR